MQSAFLPARAGWNLTATEAALLGLWTALLGRGDIGPDDDFFALGGHSLLATRLVAAVADRLGVELPLISVFEAPTIRAARALRRREAGGCRPGRRRHSPAAAPSRPG